MIHNPAIKRNGGGGGSTADATATSADIRSGKTAYGASGKITGSMANVTLPQPTISVSSSGVITATETVSSSGYVTGGTKTQTQQLNTKAGTTITPNGSQQTAISANTYATGNIYVGAINMQSNKTVTPSGSRQYVTPDYGYSGLSQVTVNAVSLQNRTVTPSTSTQYVTADGGYSGLGQVTVEAAKLEPKTITPTTSTQTFYPSPPNIGFSSVTVNGASGGGSSGGNGVSANFQTVRIKKIRTLTFNKAYSYDDERLIIIYRDFGRIENYSTQKGFFPYFIVLDRVHSNNSYMSGVYITSRDATYAYSRFTASGAYPFDVLSDQGATYSLSLYDFDASIELNYSDITPVITQDNVKSLWFDGTYTVVQIGYGSGSSGVVGEIVPGVGGEGVVVGSQP